MAASGTAEQSVEEQGPSEGQMAGAKALLILKPLLARLKSCPFTRPSRKPAESSFSAAGEAMP
jgi:hypothetical protein